MSSRLRIKQIELSSNALFAPMAGYSDMGARFLAREYGAGLSYSEMVSAKGLIFDNEQSKVLLNKAPNETPFAAQLFGHSPNDMFKAIKLLPEGIDIVDINMGCPAPKIVKNGDGSALLKDSCLAGEIVAAAVEASERPITVKMRLGFEMGNFVADKVASAVEKAGAAAVTVHGRYRDQMYSGSVDKNAILAVKESISIPVIANGDVKTIKDYERMLCDTKADGVMIGRGALGNYRIFADICKKEVNRSAHEDIFVQIEYLKKQYPDRIVANLMKSHICAYASGIAGKAKQIREKVHIATSLEEVLSIVNEYFV